MFPQEVGGPPPNSGCGGGPPPRGHYDDYRGGDHSGGGGGRGRGNSRYHWSASNNGRGGGGRGGGDWGPPRGGPDYDRGRPRDDGPRPGGPPRDDFGGPEARRDTSLSDARNTSDICRLADKVWEGGLILKNSLFPSKFHHVEGSPRVADALKDPETGLRHLKITQRLRLDQGKLDDVSRRMDSSSSHAIFLCVTSAAAPQPAAGGENPDIQSRPLRNLVSYLKQKEAAGVISMGGGGGGGGEGSEVSGVLYCFPPCQFSYDLLQREAPGVQAEENKDDHLVVLVVCGGGAAS